MLKIAICDDSDIDRKNVEKCLCEIEGSSSYKFEITTFHSGEDICKSVKNQKFDLIFFDILMDGITGIEAARQIRKDDKECYFAFISSYDNSLRELFGIKTVAFIDKPFTEKQIKDVVDKVCERIFEVDNKAFTFSYKGVERFVYLKDIIFFESFGYQISLITKNEQYIFNDSLKNIWNNLITSTEFVMPHKSYIVNLKNCEVKSSKHIILKKGNETIEVSIGRKYKEETMQRYMKVLKGNKI